MAIVELEKQNNIWEFVKNIDAVTDTPFSWEITLFSDFNIEYIIIFDSKSNFDLS